MRTEPRLWCVIPAAGRGQRFGAEVPKQYAPLAGHNVLWHTLNRLGRHPAIAGLVLVVAAADALWHDVIQAQAPRNESPLPSGERARVRGESHQRPTDKPILIAHGGETRADSVLAGLNALPDTVKDSDFVLVHDAARPCLRGEDIDRLIREAGQGEGGLLAAPLRDTLKRADNEGRVAATEPREARWRALTPQMFRRAALMRALESAVAAGIAVTDESMAMERMGASPLLVEGSEDNLKITRPGDLALAECLLERLT